MHGLLMLAGLGAVAYGIAWLCGVLDLGWRR